MRCPTQDGSDAGLWVEYCAGTLRREEAQRFEDHLVGCEQCRRIVEAQKAVWASLDTWEEEPVPADFNRKVYQRIDALDRQPWWKRWLDGEGRVIWKPIAGVTAAAAVLAVVLLLRPAPVPVAPAAETKSAAAESVDPDKLEQALQDMDMLQHLSSGAGEEL